MMPNHTEYLADRFYSMLRARCQPKEAIVVLALIFYKVWQDSAVGEYSLDEFADGAAELIKEAEEELPQ